MPRTSSIFTGRINRNNLLAFVFGVVFVFIILVFSTQYPNPTQIQSTTFTVILALAAAGVGAILPGSLGVEWKGVGGLPAVRAGGAIAMFALVLAFQSKIEGAVVKLVPPQESPKPIAQEFLNLLDSGNIAALWALVDNEAKGITVGSEEEFRDIYNDVITPLGAVIYRYQIGSSGITSPSGYPVGIYRNIAYRTKYGADGQNCRQEMVTLRANEDIQWKVFSYVISPEITPC